MEEKVSLNTQQSVTHDFKLIGSSADFDGTLDARCMRTAFNFADFIN